jgi:hypothetical protein
MILQAVSAGNSFTIDLQPALLFVLFCRPPIDKQPALGGLQPFRPGLLDQIAVLDMRFARAFEMKLALAVVAGQAGFDRDLRRAADGDPAPAVSAGGDLRQRARGAHVLQIDPIELKALDEQIGDGHVFDLVERDPDGQIGVAGVVLIGEPPRLDAEKDLPAVERPFQRIERGQSGGRRGEIATRRGATVEK